MAASPLPNVTPELAARAREHFQPLYAEPLSDDDGREIATNLLGAFGVLNEWRLRRAAQGASNPTPAPSARPTRRRQSPSTQE